MFERVNDLTNTGRGAFYCDCEYLSRRSSRSPLSPPRPRSIAVVATINGAFYSLPAIFGPFRTRYPSRRPRPPTFLSVGGLLPCIASHRKASSQRRTRWRRKCVSHTWRRTDRPNARSVMPASAGGISEAPFCKSLRNPRHNCGGCVDIFAVRCTEVYEGSRTATTSRLWLQTSLGQKDLSLSLFQFSSPSLPP